MLAQSDIFYLIIYFTGRIVKRVTVGSQLECFLSPVDQSTVPGFISIESAT